MKKQSTNVYCILDTMCQAKKDRILRFYLFMNGEEQRVLFAEIWAAESEEAFYKMHPEYSVAPHGKVPFCACFD